MAKPQFLKRKEKELSKNPIESIDQLIDSVISETGELEPTVYTQKGYDVFTPDGGRTHFVAEIEYNHETGEAKLVATAPITRLIGLQHANTKMALSMSMKKKKQV